MRKHESADYRGNLYSKEIGYKSKPIGYRGNRIIEGLTIGGSTVYLKPPEKQHDMQTRARLKFHQSSLKITHCGHADGLYTALHQTLING